MGGPGERRPPAPHQEGAPSMEAAKGRGGPVWGHPREGGREPGAEQGAGALPVAEGAVRPAVTLGGGSSRVYI